VNELSQLLHEHGRLVTLTAPGGSGKTRLAIQAAVELVAASKAGVFWVPLAPVRDPSLVADTIAKALGEMGALAELGGTG
jgi:predicted ATPase